MKRVPGYTQDELEALQQSAADLLGQRIVFKDLEVAANADVPVAQRILTTRGKVVIVVSKVDFYPAQDDGWQRALQERAIDGESTVAQRSAGQVFSKMGQAGNPLVGIVLQRGPHAHTDPLAMISRVTAVFHNDQVEKELTWKNLLTHARFGSMKLDSKQMTRFRDAVNWQDSTSPQSAFQIRDLRGDFEVEERARPKDAHGDLRNKLQLTEEGLAEVRVAAQKILDRESA